MQSLFYSTPWSKKQLYSPLSLTEYLHSQSIVIYSNLTHYRRQKKEKGTKEDQFNKEKLKGA